MKLREEVEPRLEVVASEPRLDVREPRLLPDEQDRVLADRLEERQTDRVDDKSTYHIYLLTVITSVVKILESQSLIPRYQTDTTYRAEHFRFLLKDDDNNFYVLYVKNNSI